MASVPLSSSTHAATLLFCHGCGFCKEVWSPIIKRLQKSPLIQSLGSRIQMSSFDFSYHGENRNVSQRAEIRLEDPASPYVFHPGMNWDQWTPTEVHEHVRLLREREGRNKKPLIGIGHSMGAAALWKAEATAPGTFDGLVLFEPIANIEDYPNSKKSVDFLVSVTLKRPGGWDSYEEAEKELLNSRNFSRWHPEALEAYIKGAVVQVKKENNVVDPETKFALSCHPHFEASLYSNGGVRLTNEEIGRVKCPVRFHYGGRTHFFMPEYRQQLVDKHADVYSIGEPIPDKSHVVVMEDPDASASRILETLEQLPPFRPSGGKL